MEAADEPVGRIFLDAYGNSGVSVGCVSVLVSAVEYVNSIIVLPTR